MIIKDIRSLNNIDFSDNPFKDRGYKNVNKILIIRSARMYQFNEAVIFLTGVFKEARLSALIQPQIADELKNRREIDEVIIFNNNRFSFLNFNYKLIREIRKQSYDLIVILYNNVQGLTYIQLDFIVLLCKPRYAVAYDKTGQCREIKLIYWLASLFTRARWIELPLRYTLEGLDIVLFSFSLIIFLPISLCQYFLNKIISLAQNQ